MNHYSNLFIYHTFSVPVLLLLQVKHFKGLNIPSFRTLIRHFLISTSDQNTTAIPTRLLAPLGGGTNRTRPQTQAHTNCSDSVIYPLLQLLQISATGPVTTSAVAIWRLVWRAGPSYGKRTPLIFCLTRKNWQSWLFRLHYSHLMPASMIICTRNTYHFHQGGQGDGNDSSWVEFLLSKFSH